MRGRIGVAAAVALLAAGNVAAAVKDSSASGFTVENVEVVPVDADTAWKALVHDIDRWWPKDHTWWGQASKLSIDAREALDKRVICDLFEGNAPFAPRYVLPDYERAIRQGLQYLELPPPTDLADALAFLQIMYAHVPSVTTYPLGAANDALADLRAGRVTGAAVLVP